MPESVKQRFDESNLRGLRVDAADEDLLREAIGHALHYRGDVTIRRRGDEAPVSGYLFDQRADGDGNVQRVRLLPEGADEPVSIAFEEIAELHISGRDTAAGKSWETWVRKYIERKTAAQEAADAKGRGAE